MRTDLQKSRFNEDWKKDRNKRLNKQNSNSSLLNRVESTKEEEDDGFFGPALPPGFKKQQNSPERWAIKYYDASQ